MKNKETDDKKVSRVYIAKWKSGDRYIYYNSATKERITAKKGSFSSIKEFKGYIQNKGSEYNSRMYKSKTEPIKIGVNVIELRSNKTFKNREVRITGEYTYKGQTYFATSHVLKNINSKGRINALKDQVKSNIALQIIKPTVSLASYNSDDFIDDESEEIQRIIDDINKGIKYTIVYPSYKNA